MTKTERNRSSRRISLAAMGVSGVLHVAALLLVTLPTPELSTPAERLALLPPLIEPVMLELEAAKPSETAAEAPLTGAAGAGLPGAADAARPRPAPQAPAPDAAVAPQPVAGEQFTLAALDTLTNAEQLALPAETAPVVLATLPAGESSGAGQAAQPAAPAHVPGSAARAKGGGKAAASAGAGASEGFGGITIKIGGGGKKKHPPRGMPGRGRW